VSTWAIEAQGLVKEFKSKASTVTAVGGLDLQIAAGETYGLIGPDGAGKTTATRVLLGLLTRTAGTSSILGFDSMRDAYAIRERVGYIAQQNILPADLTVEENLRFFAGVHKVSQGALRLRIPELLDFAGLGAFSGRLAGKLSGGMKKKLALACSLIHAPQVVLLDEPTLGVDPVSRREFWNLLGDLRAARGLTIFVCTPYMDEAERCTQVGLMYGGRLIAYGTPAEIKARLPGRLLEVSLPQLGPARELLARLPGVLEVQSYGARLHVFVDDAGGRGPQITAALAAAGLGQAAVRAMEVRMEEAFISLIRQEAGSADPEGVGARPVEASVGGV
jgi:ABC-2 type transport system ATP-binding protein